MSVHREGFVKSVHVRRVKQIATGTCYASDSLFLNTRAKVLARAHHTQIALAVRECEQLKRGNVCVITAIKNLLCKTKIHYVSYLSKSNTIEHIILKQQTISNALCDEESNRRKQRIRTADI